MAKKEEELTGAIIDSIIAVHRTLGPGFDKSIYCNALMVDLENSGLRAERDKETVVTYEGVDVGRHIIDLMVEGRVAIDVRNEVELKKAHYAQLRSCLRSTGLEVGLLTSFAGDRADFRRVE